MECKGCHNDLWVANSANKVVNDDSPDKQTELYTVLTMVCVNPNCDNYAGADMKNPKHSETLELKQEIG